MKLSNKVYDRLNWLSKFIPLLVTFVGVLLPIFHIGEDTCNIILTIIGALGTFLNGTLNISSINYLKTEKENTNASIN